MIRLKSEFEFYCFENCRYLINVAYKYWKFHQLHIVVFLNTVFSKIGVLWLKNGKKQKNT